MSRPAFTAITVAQHGATAIVTFDRPDQLNAMSRAMQSEIVAALDHLEGDPGTGVIVLTGAGKASMAGADLKEYAAFTPEDFRHFQLRGRHLYERIERNQKPVIAAVNGYALGGGFEMVLACDLVVARRGARMGLPEVRLGLVPGGGGTQRLTARLGPNRAFALLATGDHRPAEEFHAWGLVENLVDEDPLPAALALAERLLGQPGEAVRALKRLVRTAREAPLPAGLDAEAEALQALYESEAGQARIQAFMARSAAKDTTQKAR